MRRRTVVAKALSLAIIPSVAFAGCGIPGGGSGNQRVRAGTGGGAGGSGPQATIAAPAAVAGGAGAGAGAAAAPAPPLLLAATHDAQPGPAATPTTGHIEVHYQRDGGSSKASLVGPGGGRSAPVTGGVAVFDDLPPGAYQLEIGYTSDAASGTSGVGIGGAFDATRYGSFEVAAGQILVLTCDQTTCSSS